ncbi:MAG: N-acetyltransferase family protein [Myxococcota bacterium]
MDRIIRFAQPDDAPLIHRFIRALAEYEREPDAVEVGEDALRLQMERETPPFECLLAESRGAAVGFALFFQSYSTWKGRSGIYLEDLFVDPGRRGEGHGLALLGRLAELALERDCARLEWAVLDWNEPAIRFYRSLGSQPLDEWTTHRLTGDALVRLAALSGPRRG